ncbi:MerR family transcriptional regulator [Streptomyces sp. x-80]|uniref:MerR family transcriptional regulator n=1 Tax=Streptomyces sp. x-80 TaxID=2789282 RepID=UPI00397F2191
MRTLSRNTSVSDSPTRRLLTTIEAANLINVRPDRIRQWVHRGILAPAARYRGRGNLYLEIDVLVAEKTMRRPR